MKMKISVIFFVEAIIYAFTMGKDQGQIAGYGEGADATVEEIEADEADEAERADANYELGYKHGSEGNGLDLDHTSNRDYMAGYENGVKDVDW